MGIAFFLLSVVLYLALVVDWRELMGVLRGGGWPAVVLNLVLTLLIYIAITSPTSIISGHH